MLKRRYVYVLLFSVPIALTSGVLALAAFGVAAGALWLFVFGDNPWPAPAGSLLSILAVLVFAGSFLVLVRRAYVAGRAQESRASLDPRPVLLAVASTALLLVTIVSYQWRVGNIGAKTDGVLCLEFCQGKGFAASGMPPRNAGPGTCSCYDAAGREAEKVPMEIVSPPN